MRCGECGGVQPTWERGVYSISANWPHRAELDDDAERAYSLRRFTAADAIESSLAPHGVAVVVEGKHLCMMMRGVQKQESSTVTSAMRGTFISDARTRSELLGLIS